VDYGLLTGQMLGRYIRPSAWSVPFPLRALLLGHCHLFLHLSALSGDSGPAVAAQVILDRSYGTDEIALDQMA
jgi:hypothetical protein